MTANAKSIGSSASAAISALPAGTRTRKHHADHTGDHPILGLTLFIAFGALLLMLYAVQVAVLQSSGLVGWFAAVAVSASIGGAALLAGGLLGFLFGFPHTLSHEQQDTPANTLGYVPNTNLEQVSDWLTKILLGVGLTQLSSVPGQLQQIAALGAAALGKRDADAVFVASLLIYFLVTGFLFGFIWTRLYLLSDFKKADNIRASQKALSSAADSPRQLPGGQGREQESGTPDNPHALAPDDA
jgi:hypothetical protein